MKSLPEQTEQTGSRKREPPAGQDLQRELLKGLADKLETVEPFNTETAEAALRAYAEETGVKAGLLINGSRTMLTGQAVGPSMFEIFDVLGKEASAERLRSGIR